MKTLLQSNANLICYYLILRTQFFVLFLNNSNIYYFKKC